MTLPLTTLEEQRAHYRDIKWRLGLRGKARPILVSKPLPQAVPPKVQPSAAGRDFLFIRTPAVRDARNPVWKRANAEIILREVVDSHRISVGQIKGKTRAREVVAARFEAYYRLSTELGYSLPMIGKFMGDKEHTGVMYGISRHRAKLESAGL